MQSPIKEHSFHKLLRRMVAQMTHITCTNKSRINLNKCVKNHPQERGPPARLDTAHIYSHTHNSTYAHMHLNSEALEHA